MFHFIRGLHFVMESLTERWSNVIGNGTVRIDQSILLNKEFCGSWQLVSDFITLCVGLSCERRDWASGLIDSQK